jgi:flagellar assembly protein FliH
MKKIGSNVSSIKSFFMREIDDSGSYHGSAVSEEYFQKADFYTDDSDMMEENGYPAGREKTIEKILEENRRKAEAITHDAYQKGFNEGVKKGYQDAKAKEKEETEEKFNRLQNLIDEISRFRESQLIGIEGEVLDMVFLITKKLIRKELALDRDIILHVVKDAIEGAVGNEKIKIIVNPEDRQNILEHRKELLSLVEGLKNIAVEADSSIEKGGCLIETAYGDIDARLDRQLEIIEQNMKNISKGGPC